MNRIAILVACTVLLASSSAFAQAVVSLTAPAGDVTIGVGETVTLQINLSNPDPLEIFGVAISVSEYDEAIVDFQSGESVANYLNGFCPGPGMCFGGLANLASPTLVESAIAGFDNRVQIALSAGLTAVPNDGSLDQGIDGMEGTSQFDVTFVGVAPGVSTLQIGTTYQGDGIILEAGVVEDATGDSITITVPEPGALAASMVALGSVLGMAGMRRRI